MTSRDTAFNPPIGAPPAVQFVAVDRLDVDDSYQRQLDTPNSKRHVLAIARDWDWRLCVPLLVSQRGGALYVIDGQHRLEAARLRGDIPHLPCCVGAYASAAEEAALFVASNRARRPMNRLDDYRAAVASGDAASVEIERLLRAAGLAVARVATPALWQPGELGCTKGLYSALAKHGEERLARVLSLIGEAFAGQNLRLGGTIFSGLLKLETSAAPPARDHVLAALRRRTADGWGDHRHLAHIRGGDQRALAFRRAIEEEIARTGGIAAPPSLASAVAPAAPVVVVSPTPPEPHRAPPPAAGGEMSTFERQDAALRRGAGLVERIPMRDRRYDGGTLGGVVGEINL